MLGDEHRMSAERCLLPITARHGRRQPIRNERPRVVDHRRKAFGRQVLALTRAKVKALPKGRAAERHEHIIQISHDTFVLRPLAPDAEADAGLGAETTRKHEHVEDAFVGDDGASHLVGRLPAEHLLLPVVLPLAIGRS